MFDKDTILWKMKPDQSGLEFAYTDDILIDLQNLFKRVYPNANLDAYTPLGQLITYNTECIMGAISTLQDGLNYHYLGGSGQMLNIWAYNQYRALRKQGTNGYATIELQGIPNTPILKGLIVSDGENKFILDNDVTIGNDGKVLATFVSQSKNENISLANTITQIVTPQVGLERVNNPAPSVAGVSVESDSEFYARCQTYGSLFKNSSFASIMSNIAQVQGVSKIGGYENSTDKQVVKDGVTIAPHSFIAVILGGSDLDIANTISKAKPPGAGMMGDISVTLTILDKDVTYKFQRPKPASIKVSVNIQININSPSSFKEFIQHAVQNYISSLKIGDTLTQPDLSQFIVRETIGFIVKDVKLARKDGAYAYTPIQLNLDELAVIDSADIVVTAQE